MSKQRRLKMLEKSFILFFQDLNCRRKVNEEKIRKKDFFFLFSFYRTRDKGGKALCYWGLQASVAVLLNLNSNVVEYKNYKYEKGIDFD